MCQKIDPEKKFFNTKIALKKYGDAVIDVGLWKSEQIFFEKYASKNDNILDIGCGAGRTTFALYDLGYHNIIGIDIADILIKCANHYCKILNKSIKFKIMDASYMSFEKESFDIAFFSYNGLTGIPTQEKRLKVLNDVYRVLKNNGYFIFTAHDRNEDVLSKTFWKKEEERWKQGKNNPSLYEYGDVLTDHEGKKEFLHYYSYEEMRSFIEKTKFHIVETAKRKDIINESEIVKKFAKETYFWVLKK